MQTGVRKGTLTVVSVQIGVSIISIVNKRGCLESCSKLKSKDEITAEKGRERKETMPKFTLHVQQKLYL